jgi:hypothetical protein
MNQLLRLIPKKRHNPKNVAENQRQKRLKMLPHQQKKSPLQQKILLRRKKPPRSVAESPRLR